MPFAYGFRPFFLLAGIWAILPMAVLLGSLHSGRWPSGAIALLPWHGREMLLGFAGAAIAGFLLTAVPSWTRTRALSGFPLVVLVALWLAARIVPSPLWQSQTPLADALSLAFFPALAIMLAYPLIASRNLRNLPFLVLLGLLFTAELAFLGPHFGWFAAPPFDPLRLAVNTILLMVVVVGGRIIPAFTRNALAAREHAAPVRSARWIDSAAIASAAAVLVGDVLAPGGRVSGVIAAVAAVTLALRFRGWQSVATRGLPLLWVLHVGYGWLVAGLALKAAWHVAELGWAQHFMHAITAGAFGTMILGVTTRAALGHTGRPLEVGRAIVIAYALVSLAALLRVLGPWLLPTHYVAVLGAAALAWAAAFALYLAVYTPILMLPRADGRPG